ncbi:MAG: hypothetical protein GEU90_10840 [Gemmatimonas sp.]|nr:hypothetical protein [Gemmatimonas sp.]
MESTKKFMLVFREATPHRYQEMSAERRRQALRDWNSWCDELAAAGRLKDGSPLYSESRVVSGTPDTGIVDGPFAEAKELIGGYIIIEASDLDDATEVAEGSPNLKFGQTVEIRHMAETCHLARSLGLTTMREAAAVH